jgi:predicted nucleic acid-binding protein
MELIVDANILFSFFKPESVTRDLIKLLYIRNVRLFIPEFAIDEIFELKAKICEFCEIDETEFETSLALLYEILIIISKHEFDSFVPEAKKLLPKHPKDALYFALALYLHCPIWSNEKRFRLQSKIRVYTTSELLDLINP